MHNYMKRRINVGGGPAETKFGEPTWPNAIQGKKKTPENIDPEKKDETVLEPEEEIAE